LSDTEQTKKLQQGLKVIEQIIDILRGRKDVRTRLTAITAPDPANLVSSSNLSDEQVNAVEDCKFAASRYPEIYGPMNDSADITLRTALSLKGYGVEKGIALNGAIEQSNLFKSIMGTAQEQPQKKRGLPGFRKEETKQ